MSIHMVLYHGVEAEQHLVIFGIILYLKIIHECMMSKKYDRPKDYKDISTLGTSSVF